MYQATLPLRIREIDGLRGIAVLAVIFNHVNEKIAPGGFFGVDIFFVISGYLITSILIHEHLNFSSIGIFYGKRLRRISPPLIVLCFIVFILFYFFMLPFQLNDLKKSIISNLLFLQNLYFMNATSGYFAPDNKLLPLLHTWSLGVEIQFYLIYPLFFYFSKFRKRIEIILVVLAFISLFLSFGLEFYTQDRANYYFTPSRFWEFCIGGLIYLIPKKGSIALSNGISAISLVGLIGLIFFYDHDLFGRTLPTFICSIFVALILCSLRQSSLVSVILKFRPLVFIGVISYSLYLVHYPIVAGYLMLVLDHLTVADFFVLVILTFILGLMLYRFVEQPAGRIRFNTRSLVSLILANCLFAVLILLPSNEKLIGGLNPLNTHSGFSENIALRDESWAYLRKLSGDINYGVDNNQFDLRDWAVDESRNSLLIVGDSHSKDLFNVFRFSEKMMDDFNLLRFGVQLRELDSDSLFWTSPNLNKANVVIIVGRYSAEDVRSLPNVLDTLMAMGKTVFVVYRTFEFSSFRGGGWSLADKFIYESKENKVETEVLIHQINDAYTLEYNSGGASPEVESINESIRIITEEKDVPTVNRMSYICPPRQGQRNCFGVDSELNKLFYDYGHHTLKGGIFFGKIVDELGLESIFGKPLLGEQVDDR